MALQRLDNLVSIGQLKAEPARQAEIDGLIRSGGARLGDSEVASLSIEGRFDLAYNAAHSLALAALRYHGYRSESRYLVFQLLEETIGLPTAQWRVLDQAHAKRNQLEYGGTATLDTALVEAMIRVAREILKRVTGLGQLR